MSHRFVFPLIAGLAFVAGCGDDASESAASSSTTTPASSTTAATTSPPTTAPAATVPAATTPAPTTTVIPEPLVLREDGLGPFDFGSTPTAVIDAITAQLGAPARNDVLLYEIPSEFDETIYESSVPPYYVFAFPVGQTVCWTGDFCAEFGGLSQADMSFSGWSYRGTPQLFASSSNLTIGAKWSDFPSLEVGPSGPTCGIGTHHGIYVGLNVAGGWNWLVEDAVGTSVENLPDPAAARVDFMRGGSIPHFFEPTC